MRRDRKKRFGALRAALIEGERSRPSTPLDVQPLIRRKRQDRQRAKPSS
jgi:Arc/MetJ-type ribon-helix-helix transcriptional regulator